MAAVAVAACGGGPRDENAFSGSDASAGATAADSATSDDPGDDGGVLDVGGGGTAADDGGDSSGCAKIDFLFVIDNSGSMGAHQTSLINSFGPFIDTILSTVDAQDFHVMVVDSDSDADLQTCEPCTPNSFWCGDYCDVKPTFDACEGILGAGEIQPYNNAASNTVCGVPGGRRYLTSELDPAAMKSTFACMGKVGIFGSGAEQPMSALAQAVTTQSAPGGCNEGFLRDDAVLVVTVITDDYPVPNTPDDASTVGDPQAWYDAVIAAKKGSPEAVVMLGLINTADATCVSGAGDPIVHPTERFVDFVGRFGDRGIAGNICDPDYNAFFQQAVGLIDTTCDEFVPVG